MAALSFCGCSVTGFSSSLGWGQNRSCLDVQVVQDDRNGDFFNPPPLGMPCYFYFGPSFHFWGILQSWQHNNSDKGGFNQYALRVEDPREILEGTQLIVNNYNGSTFTVPNILNCYGYWENALGFGGASANASGMPWYKIASAIQLMTNLPLQGVYGGPLYYRGVHYAVDLSMLPVPPSYYRVGSGASISLMQAISQLCEDSGMDFFVELDPGALLPTIRIFTVSRYLQPPLGTISSVTNTNWGGTVVRSDNGLELRNDPTTHFVIGGSTCDLYQTDAIQPFWGYNIDGSPTDNMIVFIQGLGYCNGAYVNVQEIADCFNNGAQYYFLTEFEMRAALGGFWAQYVKYESAVLNQLVPKYATIGPLGLADPTGGLPANLVNNLSPRATNIANFVKALNANGLNNLPVNVANAQAAVNTAQATLLTAKQNRKNSVVQAQWPALDAAIAAAQADLAIKTKAVAQAIAANQAGNNNVLATASAQELQETKQQMLEEFVKEKAQQWYGKKYWVSLPFVTSYTDPDTLQIMHSNDVTDGGWLPDGATPLGLSTINLLKFMTDDTRYQPLAIFWPQGIDLESSNPEDSAWEPGGFYSRITVDNSIFIWPQSGIPAVVATIGTAVEQEQVDVGGDTNFMGTIFGVDGKSGWKAFQGRRAFGTMDLAGTPARYQPIAVAIPLKSNVSTYGPWYLAGPPGKVVVEQVTDLTPWTYGGTSFMNLAATAKVESAVTLMQIAEKGNLELVGMPMCPLGRQLLAGGPDVTNIEVHYSSDRLSTSYRFQTFTDTALTRYNKTVQDRIKILGHTSNEIKKSALLALAKQALDTQVLREVGALKQLRRHKWQVSWSSPDPVFISSAIQDDITGKVRVSTALCDPTEGWTGIGALDPTDSLLMNSSLCSVSALVRPFSNSPTGSVLLPSIIAPTGVTGVAITVNQLNPFNHNYSDLEYLSAGVGSGVDYVVNNGIDWQNVRGVAIAMPFMLTGWGYDIYGKLTPTDPSFSPGYNVGPVDFLWDSNRGVWTAHDSIFGKLMNGALPGSGGTGMMTILGTTNSKLPVTNLFSAQVNSGTIVCANFQPYLNVWAVIAADCPPGS